MRRRKYTSVNIMLKMLLAAVLFVLLILLIFWYQEGLTSYKPGEKTCYYIAGMRVECDSDAKFTVAQNGLHVKDSLGERTLDHTPILYQEEKKIALTANYMIMRPKEMMKVYRLNTFSELSERNGKVTAKNYGKSKEVTSGFLYDGADSYIFLEPTELHIGNRKVKLAPLSYVNCIYQQYVEIYESNADGMEVVELFDVDVEAVLSGDVILDLGRDIITQNGSDALLYSAVDSLNVLEMD